MYRRFLKYLFDFVLSLTAVVLLSPFFVLFTPIVAVAMRGNPFFVQKRPGKNGRIFRMVKYRTMTNAKDSDGNLLPDDERLTAFGKAMRKMSIDELPEIFNILSGQMSIVGPRPQLVKDLVFFDEATMLRQSVRPGLTGWAQVNGRNNVTWEQKFQLDEYYIENISVWLDIKILFLTVFKVFARKDINTDGMETAEDYGDYLLRTGHIEKDFYDKMCKYAAFLKTGNRYDQNIILSIQENRAIGEEGYSVLMSVYIKSDLQQLRQCLDSVFEQVPAPKEIVIVEDGPVREDVGEYLAALESEGRVKLVPLETNVGLGNALDAGSKECVCEWIARMDTDDVCAPDRIQKQVAYLQAHPEIDVLGSKIAEFSGDIADVVSVRSVPTEHDAICEYMKSRCPFNHMTVMMRRSVLQAAGGYKPWLYNEDSYLWARMYLAGAKFANIAENLVYARIDADTFRRRGGYRYYKSERDLFAFMHKSGIITYGEYVKAKLIRFVVQVMMPNGVRQWFFKTFARG